MRVTELATDLGVSSGVLLNLLRTLRISATDKAFRLDRSGADSLDTRKMVDKSTPAQSLI